jgi:hypothetical protein
VGSSSAEARATLRERYGTEIVDRVGLPEAALHTLASRLVNLGDSHPAIAATMRTQVKTVTLIGTTADSGGKAAEYRWGDIRIYDTEFGIGPALLLHEMGHGAENIFHEGSTESVIARGFGSGRTASGYAFRDPMEDFAESWAATLSGEADRFAKWNPDKARIMRDFVGGF